MDVNKSILYPIWDTINKGRDGLDQHCQLTSIHYN